MFSDKIGSRSMLTMFVTTGFVICGIVEQSATVTLLANSPPVISAAEFADYVENTSYITRYCQSHLNITDKNDTNKHVHVVFSLPHIEVSKKFSKKYNFNQFIFFAPQINI